MTLQDDFPALKSSIYFNTAYVGLMSKSLYDFRTNFEQNYLFNGDNYKIDAYDRLSQTQEYISQFIGSKKEQTFFVSNFSVGIRFVLDSLTKGSNVLYLKDDYHSLVDAIEERDLNLFGLTMEVDLEQKIDHAFSQNNFDVLIISIVQFTHGLKIDFDFLENLKERYPQLLIIGDATQYIGTEIFHFDSSPFDTVVCSGYKWLLAGFGNGFIALSDHFFERTNTTRDAFFQKVFSGHFNILAAESLVFAFDYLKSNDFEQLVQKNKHLGNTFRKELIDIGWTPAYHQRKDQSSIISIATDEEMLKQLEGQNIRASYRNKYLRFSVHFYNSSSEIDQLIGAIRKLIPT